MQRGWRFGRLWQWPAEELKEGKAWGKGESHLKWRCILGYLCAKDLENRTCDPAPYSGEYKPDRQFRVSKGELSKAEPGGRIYSEDKTFW